MIDRKLFNYSFGYLKNSIFGNLYLGFGINICKPATISALLTWRCNARCLMCDYWRQKNYNEMSTRDWTRFLTELKRWHKNAHVQFSGGEPFVRKDVMEIFEHCAEIDLSYGITTNLAIMPYGGVERLVGANPFNINVSLDGIKAKTHDYGRGVQGFFTKVMNNIDTILHEISKQNKKIMIIIKTTVSNINIDQLEDIVKFVKNKGLVGVNFQPIFKWPNTLSEELWVTDFEKIEKISSKLVDMKRSGFPILSPERDILNWKSHFKEETTEEHSRGRCMVGIKNFDISPNGDVLLCRGINSKIGNLTVNKPSEIWHSKIAGNERDRILRCRRLCLATCMTKRSIKELFLTFLKMVKTRDIVSRVSLKD